MAGWSKFRLDKFHLNQDLRAQQNLMRGTIRKSNHLILDRRTVARTYGVDNTTIHRRFMQMFTDDIVRLLVGSRNMAGYLTWMLINRADKRKYQRWLIAGAAQSVLNNQWFEHRCEEVYRF